ncbi:polyprenyl diphosphate synthase [Allohahella marinimesophila]|uniref:Ditrans,polycis-undecaprenyl-diphosphate synthase ((2E,6E)-farnesyl-diphosphate specific) n=2 Tax=Allohahella marinimesophila TaxID=1054972 RepID=A0ABP7PQB6_9GAMM
MDGNNRWAKARKLPGIAGHKAGVESVRACVQTCAQAGVRYLTLFAFSSENWRRPEDEVNALMRLFLIALKREVRKLHRNKIRLRIMGDRSAFSTVLQASMAEAEELTADNTAMTLIIAANYGGRADIAHSVRQIAQQVRDGNLEPRDITEDLIQQHLYLGEVPPPDLCIRTANEQRISNFMLWQMAYSEFYFSTVFWPDFKTEQMRAALTAYSQRVRRFGQTDDQIARRIDF